MKKSFISQCVGGHRPWGVKPLADLLNVWPYHMYLDKHQLANKTCATNRTIQDLLGHNWVTTTQRYCKVSNMKVQRDYYKAIEIVMERTSADNTAPD